jgi:lipid-A-disaccharide synthase
LVASGTATLETACLGTPMIVVYRTSWLSYLLGRLLIRIKNIGLVNIVAGKTIVPELIQHQVEAMRLANTAARFLQDKDLRASVREELHQVKQKLGKPGASSLVAKTILATT